MTDTYITSDNSSPNTYFLVFLVFV